MSLKSKEQVVAEKLGSVNESVYKMGDLFRMKTIIDIPKSLINAFVSKAKKENGIDVRENWSDTDLVEMFVTYLTSTYLTVESLPVTQILGETTQTPGDVQSDIQPEETDNVQPVQPIQPVQPETQEVQGEIQPVQPVEPIQPVQPAQ